MKPELKKRLSLSSIIKLLISVTTIIFAVLSIIYGENYLLRILTQVSLFIIILINGIQTLVDQKQKSLGYLLIGVAAFILFIIITNIVFGFKKGGL